MMATPHMLAGAAIGRALRRPSLAWPAAFASHFLLDFTPHLDSHALFGVEKGGPRPPEAATAVVDFVLGGLLIGWLMWRQPDRRVVLGAAFFAILTDLLDNVPPWGEWFSTWSGTTWLSAVHGAFEHNVTPAQWPVGVGTQAAVIASGLWVICGTNRIADALSAKTGAVPGAGPQDRGRRRQDGSCRAAGPQQPRRPGQRRRDTGARLGWQYQPRRAQHRAGGSRDGPLTVDFCLQNVYSDARQAGAGSGCHSWPSPGRAPLTTMLQPPTTALGRLPQ